MTTDPVDEATRGAFWLACAVRVVAGLAVIFAYVAEDHRAEPGCAPSAASAPRYSYERDTPAESALAIRQPRVCRAGAPAAVVWR